MKKYLFLSLAIFLFLGCVSNNITKKNELIPKIEDYNYESHNITKKNPLISEDSLDSFLASPKIEEIKDIQEKKSDKKILFSEDIDYITKITKFNEKKNIKKEQKKDKNYIINQNIENNKEKKIAENKESKNLNYFLEEDSISYKNFDNKNFTDNSIVENSIKKDKIEDKKFDLTNIDNLKVIEKDLIEITGEENKNLKISLKDSGWIIKSINPAIIELISRENSQNYTLFDFFLSNIGEVSIIFIRFNEKDNSLLRQPYKIIIKPKEIISKEKTKDSKQDNTKKSKGQKEDDQRKILANRLFDQKRFDEALSLYNELTDEGKSDSEILYKKGKIYLLKNNLTEAKSSFLDNLKEKDNVYYNDSLIELINILKKEKKYSEAINSYFKYWKGEVDEPKIDILLASIYFEMQDYNTAANEYRKYLSKYPQSQFDDMALFYLAYSIENYKISPDFKEAYRLYKLLVSKYPESKYYELSKSRMLYLERHYLKVN